MKKAPKGHENLERWLVSYSDFMTLIFAVFVVLYSFAMTKQSESTVLVRGVVQAFTEIGFIPSVPGIITLPGPIAKDLNSQSFSAASSASEQVNSPASGAGGVMDFGINASTDTVAEMVENTDDINSVEGNMLESEVENPTQGNQVKNYDTQAYKDNAVGDGGNNQGQNPETINDGAQGPAQVDSTGEGIQGSPFDSIKKSISESITDTGLQNDIAVDEDPRWLTIHVNSSLLFAQGSSSVLSNAKPVIEQIGRAIAKINNYVRVRGYTDNQFIPNGIYKNTWDLSAARATSVLELLVKNGVDPTRLAIEGYGQYSPFYSNSTKAGQAQNRRVVIAISRYAISPNPLEVVEGDGTDAILTPTQIKAGSNELELKRNADGSVDFNL